jgi:hypothetical protein
MGDVMLLLLAESILDVIVRNEIKVKGSEVKVTGKNTVDFIQYRFAGSRDDTLHGQTVVAKLHHTLLGRFLEVVHESPGKLAKRFVEVLRQLGNIEWEGINFSFVEVTAIREDSHEPIEQARVESA